MYGLIKVNFIWQVIKNSKKNQTLNRNCSYRYITPLAWHPNWQSITRL